VLEEIARKVPFISHIFRKDLAYYRANHWLSSSRRFLMPHTNSYNVAIFQKTFLVKAEQESLNFLSYALNCNKDTYPH